MTGATPARWPDASGKAPAAGPRAKAALGRRSSGEGLPGGERDPGPSDRWQAEAAGAQAEAAVRPGVPAGPGPGRPLWAALRVGVFRGRSGQALS